MLAPRQRLGGAGVAGRPVHPTHDGLTAELTVVGPKAGANACDPLESILELFDEGRTSIGIWERTPGSWPSEKVGLAELMHFVAGHGWITDADGTRHEIGPG